MTAEQLSEAEFHLRGNSLIQDPHMVHPVLHVFPVGQSGGSRDVDQGRVHVVARHVEIGCPYRHYLRVRRNCLFHDDVERLWVSEVMLCYVINTRVGISAVCIVFPVYVCHRIRMID